MHTGQHHPAIEMHNAIRQFLQGARYQELLVEALAGLVSVPFKSGVVDDALCIMILGELI